MSYFQTKDIPIIYVGVLRYFAFVFLGKIWDGGVKISRSIYSMLTKFGGIVPPAKNKVTCYNVIISYLFTHTHFAMATPKCAFLVKTLFFQKQLKLLYSHIHTQEGGGLP